MNSLGSFSIVEYYKKYVIPIDPQNYWVKSDRMMVCPLHADINPSMGVIKGKDGVELYHCFGCNKWGNIVDLHKKVNRRLNHKYLSDEESLKDLCRIFNVEYTGFEEDTKGDDSEDVRQEIAIRNAMDSFDISDFRQLFIDGKLKRKGIGYFNALTMTMVNEIKTKGE